MNFRKHFTNFLLECGLEAEEPTLLNRTYEMLLDFHATNPTRPISSKLLQAAGARAIQEMALRRNQRYEFRGIYKRLKISMRDLACFPSIPRREQIVMIFESIADKISAQMLTKTKSYVSNFYKRVPYPNALVGIALYHASISRQERFTLSTIATIVNISASTLYILKNKFPKIPECTMSERVKK